VTRLLPVTTAAVVAFAWPTPAFACGGACSTGTLGVLSVLAAIAIVAVAASRAVSFIRQRHLSRTFEENA
jgi:hypothetical protein